AAPSVPAAPKAANTPAAPSVPSAPSAPSTPAAPTAPSAANAAPPVPGPPASAPGAPSAPGVPVAPAGNPSAAPSAPGAPSAPSVPSIPTAPSAPGIPAPGVASNSSIPSAPAAPGAPSAPAAPNAAAPSAPQEPATAQTAPTATKQQPKTDKAVKPASEEKRYGQFTRKQWIGGGIVVVLGLAVLLALAVFGTRYFFSTDFGANFLERYDGHSTLPDSAPVGIPVWLSWQHFFNVFFMVLIIRTGIQIRYERKPSAYVTPKRFKKKISLTLWFHLTLDILWIINGIVFIILLFVTGHWMRIVPTSWDVFPNALSAGLQYLTLDWPTENGWVHYNALQLLSYFAVVFIAAPLAIISGFRMSSFWSKNWTKASQLYPAPLARKIHTPVMLFFVIFIIIHVVLVIGTGLLRNLNTMYASQGDVDPSVYADNWTGFFIFLGSLVVIAAAWIAARPSLLAPVARLFGKVTAR
ncbi:cytochrome b/b6 domain-containing protein, partial [Corynebacterium casei]|uniref:cytochrome b/b6 domain-containing protein n=1 Tax=Corynebacterium casei TaxID=160386 RepID=UPI003F93DCD2